jgi:hypothetical protein
VRTLENDAKIAGSRVETLQSALDTQKGVVVQANEAEVQLRALEREAKAQRDQLESYLTRYREATARDAENAAPPDARIVSHAIVPDRPSFPKKLPIVLFTTLAAMILAAGWIVGREMLATPGAAGRVPEYPEEDALAGRAGEGDQGRFTYARQNPYEAGPPPAANATRALPPPIAAAEAERFELEALIARLSEVLPQGRGRRVLVTGFEAGSSAPDLAQALGRARSLRNRAILVAIDGGARRRRATDSPTLSPARCRSVRSSGARASRGCTSSARASSTGPCSRRNGARSRRRSRLSTRPTTESSACSTTAARPNF